MGERHIQIGEVAERTGLSLRTIRYYGEVGLAAPSMRSPGGFRLYTEADVERLLLIKRMKPLDFSLEEMADLLQIMDELAGPGQDRARLRDRLAMYEDAAEARCTTLREQLEVAEDFAARLRAASRASVRTQNEQQSPGKEKSGR
jgi:DNA-binding transcriptional MerR regulator